MSPSIANAAALPESSTELAVTLLFRATFAAALINGIIVNNIANITIQTNPFFISYLHIKILY
ncbi:hypothetical protein D3C80_2165850 [compost metagenome]